MKKILYFCVAAAGMTIMLSCGGKGGQQRVASDEQDTSAVNVIPTDKTLYGICGEETAMNTLQLLRDNGDTVMMSITNAIEAGQVFGGLMVGDRLAVMPNATGSEAVIVINQNTLLGDWVMPNPIDGSSEVGIRIKGGLHAGKIKHQVGKKPHDSNKKNDRSKKFLHTPHNVEKRRGAGPGVRSLAACTA